MRSQCISDGFVDQSLEIGKSLKCFYRLSHNIQVTQANQLSNFWTEESRACLNFYCVSLLLFR